MNQGPANAVHASRAWRALAGYAAVTFAWTWTIWWGAVFARSLSIDVPVGLAVFLGGPGPLLGTLFVLRRSARGYRRGFLGRTVDPRRVSGAWWLAMAAVAVLPALVGYLGSAAVGRPAVMDVALPAGAIAFAIGFALAAVAVIVFTRGDLALAPSRRARATQAAAALGGDTGVGVGAAWAPADPSLEPEP